MQNFSGEIAREATTRNNNEIRRSYDDRRREIDYEDGRWMELAQDKT
jgi:hypothetical protein